MFALVLPFLYIRMYTHICTYYTICILVALLACRFYMQNCFVAFFHAPALACVLVVLLAVEPSRARSPH